MELQDNQFLKIRAGKSSIILEVFEQPAERWRRPLRWELYVPFMNLVNRHKKESKIKLLNDSLRGLWAGFTGYKRDVSQNRSILDNEFIRPEKPIETRQTF